MKFTKVKPSKESVNRDHLLNFNNIPSFNEFTILAYGDQKNILEIKESLLIKRDRPVLYNKVLQNCFFLKITRSLNDFIILQCYLVMLIDMFVTVIVTNYETFSNRNKEIDFEL